MKFGTQNNIMLRAKHFCKKKDKYSMCGPKQEKIRDAFVANLLENSNTRVELITV